ATGRGIYPREQLEEAARAFARRLVAFDGLALAREHGTEVNAILLGALAASGALPIRHEAYKHAIEVKGVAVAANLRGFEAGIGVVDGTMPPPAPAVARALRTPPQFADAVAHFPEGLRPTVGEALARLIDYQDEKYAALYLERLAPFVRPDIEPELPRLVARHLAVWMTYEDAIRVADLKTRAGRFERIRAEARVPGGEIVITDYLRPDLDEIYGILPYRLVARFARWAERRWPHGRPTLAQHVRTTTILGFLRLWLLARCRWLRPRSYRAQREHERMERWLRAMERSLGWDGALAIEIARAAQMVKGYGEVRRRMCGLFDTLLEAVLPMAALEALGRDGVLVATRLAARYRGLVLQGPSAEARARALTADVLARLERGDRAGALAALEPGA
ncbi:MAG: hypothetical protein HY216_05440, partial [Candidatus Rokubacteria bacterium]|nr:hypothetical protein [Candidatus Rokubacteria bacterium]